MAYTSKPDLIRAAGGEPNLNELADLDGDGEADDPVLADAQAKADAWIDVRVRRLNGARLPFDPVPDFVRLLAADEAVYRLKVARRIQTSADDALHEDRRLELEKVELGTSIVGPDTYPVGTGGGTPVVRSRTSTDGGESRDSMKGVW